MAEMDFELQLEAVLCADADRAVRPFDAVSIAVGASQMHRTRTFTSAVRTVLVLAILALGALATAYGAGLFQGDRDPTSLHTRPVSLDAAGRLLGASVWVADVEPIPGLEASGRLQLIIGYGDALASIRGADDATIHLASDVSPAADDPQAIRLALVRDTAGCESGTVGTYRALADSEGRSIRLEAIDDACAVRATAYARVWFRTLRLHSDGGVGLIDTFDPIVQVKVPPGRWEALALPDGFSITDESRDIGFEIAKNPQGLTDPCLDDGGQLISIAPGAEAFAAYLDGLPGVDATASDATLGGHPARRIVATWTRPPDCPVTRSPLAWRTNTEDLNRLTGGLTGSDVIYVIEAPGATLVITAGPDGEALEALELLPALPTATEQP
jgi:hypothetical protein